MKKFGFIIISCLIFTGCATMKVVERWPQDLSSWVKGAPPSGYFRGIAVNAHNEREGWHMALDDAKKQICNSIGLETREEYERRVVAYNSQIDKRVIADFKCTSAALLEDVDSSIKDTYFEKWMERTQYGKKYFCNYYVLVYYPRTKIEEMKRKTAQENEKRLHYLDKCLSFAKQQESKGDFIKALRTYVYALFISDTLFRNREIRALECIYKVAGLITSLRLVGMGNYVEEFVSTHRVSVKAKLNDVPAVNVPVRFEIISGEGKVNPLVFTDSGGIATSRVSMASIQRDNRIRAFTDFSEILSIDERLRDLDEKKQINFTFSTLSKVANVKAGTLCVEIEKESWFKKAYFLTFDLREVNGLAASFDRYDIEVKGLFNYKHWLTGKVKTWSKSVTGSFNLNRKIAIEPRGKVKGILECNDWLIKTFKSMSKEKHCRKVQFILTLHGRDRNRNSCKVLMESRPISENPF